MGNFAENLNLGNRFRPPLLRYGLVNSAIAVLTWHACLLQKNSCQSQHVLFFLYKSDTFDSKAIFHQISFRES